MCVMEVYIGDKPKYPVYRTKGGVIRSENTDNSGPENAGCMLVQDKGN